MNYTTNYKLPQWVETDRIQMEHFNQAMADIDGGMTNAQGTGDLGMRHLKSILWDLCHLAYHQSGKGTYTGWRESFDFDGLNTDHRVESTTGAVVLEPENGQVRLAVDGWSGGTISFQDDIYLTLAAQATGEIISTEWSPAGYGKLTSVTFNGYANEANTKANFYAVLMRGDEELATTDTLSTYKTTGNQTYTFSKKVTLIPQETYHLKIVVTNPYGNVSINVRTTGNITLTATAVIQDSGGFITKALKVQGAEVSAWAQYSAPGSVTMTLLHNGVWAEMEAKEEQSSVTPEGTACNETKFMLTLPEAADSAQLRISINHQQECYVYGYGATAL